MVGSLFFYAYGEQLLTLLLIGSIAVNWLFGLWIGNSKGVTRKTLLIIDILINVGVFFVYKYLDFVLMNLNRFTGAHIGLTGLSIPLGISFFTFQALSYVIDVYWEKVEVQKNPFYLGLYVSLFPQLIAGPIVRYETVENEIRHRKETIEDFAYGIERFIIGLAKKAILADTFVLFADKAFVASSSGNISFMGAWFGIIAYALQLYFDFSGYSDMAIGLGRMFGFHFNENFNYPYIAKSVTTFWHRWHISLSTWFRDYVFYPVQRSKLCTSMRTSMKKKGHKKLMRIIPSFVAMLAVWSLTGIWHGANWTFLCWGLLFFVFQFAEEITGFGKKWHGIPFFAHVYTLAVVLFSFTLFRAESLTLAVKYAGQMLGIGVNGMADYTTRFLIKDNFVMLAIGILASTPLLGKLFKTNWIKELLLMTLLLLSIVFVIKGGYSPFIYFNF